MIGMTTQKSVFSLDTETMERIEQRFQEKRELAKAREKQLFGVFEQDLTEEEIWALKFLYAYMPQNDLADYDGELFLNHVRTTLEIRKKVPWGHKVDDHLFLHYVLPYRVNTENIEDHRAIFYQELAERTKHLSMADAILETNYWCHEKATYIASDLRTISPLGIIRAARGRCGEESTLAVAALRSICIPARQVYTPRWAHCDDNHAWVEAWADGKWYYFGACEPEPVLNQGWFSAPARRGMLMNCRVFSNYPGPEDIILADKWFTEINLLENYAPARKVTVQVKDREGRPVSGATVQFLLYNFAEFYPLATLTADEHGELSFKTGYGDLIVRAVKDGVFGEIKLASQAEGRIEVVIDQTGQPEGTVDFDMVPPPEREGEAAGEVTESKLKEHQKRLEEGAAIRKSFEDSFMSKADAAELAKELDLPADRVWKVIRTARGNWDEIAAFLKETAPVYGEWPLKLLESLNEKDLIDTFRPTLNDHLVHALKVRGDLPEDVFTGYVLCPRVSFEMLVPYRRYFQEAFSEADIRKMKENPAVIAEMIDRDWQMREDLPNLKGKGHPVGTFELKVGDRASLDILFVALCRSFGIPARLHPSEQKPQYMIDGVWVNAPFAAEAKEQAKAWGYLKLLKDPNAEPDAPAASYYNNFTIARLVNGVYKTLVYPHGKTDVYDEAFEVEPGSYRMTTGVRLKDGSVRVRLAYFTVRAGEVTEIPLTFRHASEDIPVLGTVDLSRKFTLVGGEQQSIAAMTGSKAALVAWLEAEREPTKHLLRELGELKASYDELGVPVVLATHDPKWAASFADASSTLPKNTVIACDLDSKVLEQWMPAFRTNEAGYPHVFVLDSQGQIRYTHSGYKPGTGKEALQMVIAVGH